MKRKVVRVTRVDEQPLHYETIISVKWKNKRKKEKLKNNSHEDTCGKVWGKPTLFLFSVWLCLKEGFVGGMLLIFTINIRSSPIFSFVLPFVDEPYFFYLLYSVTMRKQCQFSTTLIFVSQRVEFCLFVSCCLLLLKA